MKLNVHLICNDISLFNTFVESNLFGKVTIGTQLDFSNIETCDCVLVSDRVIGFDVLLDMIDKKQLLANKIFYLISSNYNVTQLNNLRIRLESMGVFCLPPKLTLNQILERFCQEINLDTKSNKNVVAFFGADSKVGCTITALGVAESFAENTSCTIGFLNLQGHISYNYISENTDGYGLDNIKTKIFSSVLSEHELRSAMLCRDNLYILPGVRTLTDFRYYNTRHVEFLVDLASRMFDIVIVDAGSNPNSGLFIGALNSTSNRYMVATQQESCYKSFEVLNEQLLKVLGIDTESFILVINRYNGIFDNSLTYKLAKSNFGMTNAVILPNVNGVFWQTEVDHKTLRHYNNAEYNDMLNKLNKIIAGQLSVEYKDTLSSQKKKRFSFLGKK